MARINIALNVLKKFILTRNNYNISINYVGQIFTISRVPAKVTNTVGMLRILFHVFFIQLIE